MLKPHIATIAWVDATGDDEGNGFCRILDQTALPVEETYRDLRTPDDAWQAIKVLAIRGAPAIGIAAAYGVCLGVPAAAADAALDVLKSGALAACEHLATSRPTAVNLFHMLERMRRSIDAYDGPATSFRAHLIDEARAIHAEDAECCRRMGEFGAPLMPSGDDAGVLTHCNTGALATGGIGTALGVLITANAQGRRFTVYADETRPLLQGARLTTFECLKAGLDCVLLTDNMAALAMRQGRIHAAIAGADRIAANGDTANKIGTYGVAVLAKHHGIPFYIAAPATTFDLALASGDEIPIEERSADEVRAFGARPTAPAEVRCYTPAFDVTPHELITAIITDRGVIEAPNPERIQAMLGNAAG